MSFSEFRSPGSDAINILPQFSIENDYQTPDFDPNPSPLKRARNSEESLSNSSPRPPANPRTNPPINKGVNNIFFKTRLCTKFRLGMCRNGENCNFAHGAEDMRQPPPNWQEMVGLRGGHGEEERRPSPGNWDDDQKIIHRMKLCKKFYNGEECPYGDRCNFLHEEPSKFRDDSGRLRESLAISVGAHTATIVGGSLSNGNVEENRPVVSNGVGSDLSRGNLKPVYWKTKMCNKWEQTGHCPFGEKCHFAHGLQGTPQSALHKLHSSGRVEFESMSVTSLMAKPHGSANDLISPRATNVGGFKEDLQGKKCLLKWKGLKKINRIYGDWLDDLPLSHNIQSRVES